MSPRRPWLPALSLALLSPGAVAQDLSTYPQFTVFDLIEEGPHQFAGRDTNPIPDVAAIWGTGGVAVYPGLRDIRAASSDASVLLGTDSIGPQVSLHAFLWAAGGDWQMLPQPSGSVGDYMLGTDLSADGTTAIGVALTSELGEPASYAAWRWTQAGGVETLRESFQGETRAEAVSADGTRVAGSLEVNPTAESRAVYWDENGSPWGVLPGSTPGLDELPSSLRALTQDGNRGAGYLGDEAFVWEFPLQVTMLPRPEGAAPGFIPVPKAISEDGQVVVGSLGSEQRSWIWTAGQGTRWLDELAAQLQLPFGLIPEAWADVEDLSADGTRLAGNRTAVAGLFDDGVWVLDLPAGGVGQVVDLGGALVGDKKPVINVWGSFAGGTEAKLSLAGLGVGATSFLVIGFSALQAPFKGGVLVPEVDVIQPVLTLLGGLQLTFDWPEGVPPGSSVFVQAWTPSGGTPAGFAATRGLELITP